MFPLIWNTIPQNIACSDSFVIYLSEPNLWTEVFCLTPNTSENWRSNFLEIDLFTGTDFFSDIGIFALSLSGVETIPASIIALYCHWLPHLPEYSIYAQLNQLPIRPEMDDLSTDKEIKLAIQQLNNSAAGAYGIRAEIYKALATNPKTFSTIQRITHDFWTEEKQPEKFNYGRLGILPKKRDLSAPGNYRGIMMLEVGKK